MTSAKNMRGFTLLELIGVIAIMAIMAAVMVPNLVREMDEARTEAEQVNLREIADALVRYVRTDKRIPSPNPGNWAAAVAGQLDLPENEIRQNSRGYNRAIYFDPLFFTASATPFAGYQQSSGLANSPVQPRAIIVSNLRGNLPGAPTSATQFNRIWDQDPNASVIADDYIRIQRINFTSLFHRVLLTNSHTLLSAYRLDAAAISAVPAISGGTDGLVSIYVIDGTELRLFSSPFPIGPLGTSLLVQDAVSFRYASNGTDWFWGQP